MHQKRNESSEALMRLGLFGRARLAAWFAVTVCLMLACDRRVPVDPADSVVTAADTAPGDTAAADGAADDQGPDARDQDADAETREDAGDAALACNGAAILCERRYDQLAYLTSHNAMSNAAEGWIAPNQNQTIDQQLRGGVRALMLDVYEDQGQTVLCHGFCQLGSKPLADGLREIGDFLAAEPRNVISIIFESYVTASQIFAAFESAGLLSELHAQPPTEDWPTLAQLIARGTRLVVFTDTRETGYPWHHYVWDFAWETAFSVKTVEGFSCDKNRGDRANPLLILNHFLTAPLASPELATLANADPLLLDRALLCQRESGRLPNFVTVDFYEIGDARRTVDVLNGVAPCERPLCP